MNAQEFRQGLLELGLILEKIIGGALAIGALDNVRVQQEILDLLLREISAFREEVCDGGNV